MLALQEWKDEKLKWNQTNYGNLTKYKNRICIFQRLCLINLKFKKHKNSKFTVLSWCFFIFVCWNLVSPIFIPINFIFSNLKLQFFSRIGLAQHEIWQPDISLYNSINHNLDYYGATNFLVEQNGNVLWVPPATFKTFCDLNLRNWPFDSHKCTLIFGIIIIFFKRSIF